MRKAVIALIVTVLVSGCENGSPTPDEAQFKEWVQDRYVSPFRNGDVDVWLQIFAKDAVGMHHTLPPLQGIDEIRGFGEFIRDNFELDVYEVSVDEVRVNGDWALTLDPGSIIESQDANSLTLSEDSSGTITFADGETLDFRHLDTITW